MPIKHTVQPSDVCVCVFMFMKTDFSQFSQSTTLNKTREVFLLISVSLKSETHDIIIS